MASSELPSKFSSVKHRRRLVLPVLRFEAPVVNSNLVMVTIDVKTLPTISGTKFIVVDATADQTFNYDAAGNLVVQHSLNKRAQESRGVAANKGGSVCWVVDKDGKVFVHDQSGRLLGQWQTKGIDKPEGIATNGTDL